jgi:hypothetical protein
MPTLPQASVSASVVGKRQEKNNKLQRSWRSQTKQTADNHQAQNQTTATLRRRRDRGKLNKRTEHPKPKPRTDRYQAERHAQAK